MAKSRHVFNVDIPIAGINKLPTWLEEIRNHEESFFDGAMQS
jgi:hypothetical protein